MWRTTTFTHNVRSSKKMNISTCKTTECVSVYVTMSGEFVLWLGNAKTFYKFEYFQEKMRYSIKHCSHTMDITIKQRTMEKGHYLMPKSKSTGTRLVTRRQVHRTRSYKKKKSYCVPVVDKHYGVIVEGAGGGLVLVVAGRVARYYKLAHRISIVSIL